METIINTAPKISAALEPVRRWFWGTGLAPDEEEGLDRCAALEKRIAMLEAKQNHCYCYRHRPGPKPITVPFPHPLPPLPLNC